MPNGAGKMFLRATKAQKPKKRKKRLELREKCQIVLGIFFEKENQ